MTEQETKKLLRFANSDYKIYFRGVEITVYRDRIGRRHKSECFFTINDSLVPDVFFLSCEVFLPENFRVTCVKEREVAWNGNCVTIE